MLAQLQSQRLSSIGASGILSDRGGGFAQRGLEGNGLGSGGKWALPTDEEDCRLRMEKLLVYVRVRLWLCLVG